MDYMLVDRMVQIYVVTLSRDVPLHLSCLTTPAPELCVLLHRRQSSQHVLLPLLLYMYPLSHTAKTSPFAWPIMRAVPRRVPMPVRQRIHTKPLNLMPMLSYFYQHRTVTSRRQHRASCRQMPNIRHIHHTAANQPFQ